MNDPDGEIKGRYIWPLFLVVIFSQLALLSDPLVRAPQLDARENLLWAERIANGSVPAEPFYRALLYPLILALATPEASRPVAGAILGLLCHLIGSWLVWSIARVVWRERRLPLFAALLYLLNPASLFYAFQLLDVTFAVTLFLGALRLALRPENRIGSFLFAGLLGGLAVLARPHFLPVLLVLPVAAAVMAERHRWRALIIWLPALLLLLGQGSLIQWRSGEFRILPWQGTYNLWAANKPGANGLYFKQVVDLSQRGNASNPARVESVYLYEQAHPEESPPYSIDAMNAYWRGKFLNHLKENPLEVAKLWFFKAYAIVNSYEQYNNLTFSFHKDRIPLLKYNPLNWGILIIFGSLGFLHLFRENRKAAFALALLILAYASTLILFYASARFRLPLVPLAAVLVGGSLHWFDGLLRDRRRLGTTVVAVALLGGITFSSFAGVRQTDTYIQDRLLMANANAELGRDAEAARWARQVLKTSPDRSEAVTIYALSYFNLRLVDAPRSEEFGTWDDQARWLQLPSTQDPATAAVFACYLWHWDRQDDATGIWRQIASNHPDPTNLAIRILSVLDKDTDGLTPEDLVLKRLLEKN